MAIEDIFEAVLTFNKVAVAEGVKAELDAGTEIDSILNEALIGALDVVGKKFSEGEMFVPEMLQAAKAMKAGLEVLKPYLRSESVASKGTVIIGTVKGDQHDIGKNLVAMMIEGAGFEVVDLGVNVDADKFVKAISEHNAGVLCLSALLTTTMPAMENAVAVIKKSGLAVKTIIGGAPVTVTFADQVGADGYSDDAPSAVELVRKLMAT